MIRHFKLVSFLLTLLLAAALWPPPAAHADRWEHADAHVAVTFPDSWTIEQDGGPIMARSGDGALQASFGLFRDDATRDCSSVETGIDRIEEFYAGTIDDWKTNFTGDWNGLNVRTIQANDDRIIVAAAWRHPDYGTCGAMIIWEMAETDLDGISDASAMLNSLEGLP